MNPDSLVDDVTGLLDVWVAGWAGCRGYRTSTEGRYPAALRADDTGEWEFFAADPTDAEFSELAARVSVAPGRILTILSNDTARFTVLAEKHDLNVTSASQTMMMVDMESQDAEDPWLPDDDLELSTQEIDGVHYAEVRSGDVIAASGRVFEVQSTAVFDKIVTSPDFQRRGLGSFIMRALAAQIFGHDITHGLLLASADGHKLYSHLGWTSVSRVLMISGDSDLGDLSLS